MRDILIAMAVVISALVLGIVIHHAFFPTKTVASDHFIVYNN